MNVIGAIEVLVTLHGAPSECSELKIFITIGAVSFSITRVLGHCFHGQNCKERTCAAEIFTTKQMHHRQIQ